MSRRTTSYVFRRAVIVIALVCTALILVFAGTASAWPPGGNGNGGGPGGGGGGGGGSTPTPAGTIYFRHGGTIWQMDGAGTPESRVPLPTPRDYGDPTYARHSDQRWFSYDISHEYDLPPFPNGRYFSDIRAGSETGQEVLLLSQPDFELISWANWAADDNSITLIGERWELDTDGLPIAVDAGIYELFVDFSSGTPVAGALAFVADLSGPMRAGPEGFLPHPDAQLAGHSWNEDGTQLAFGIRVHNEFEDASEIWIADLSTGTLSLLSSGLGFGWPQWSPDGSRIGYVSTNGTIVHELSSNRTKVLKRTPSTSWEQTFWSPTGAYFTIGHWDNLLIGEDAIYRFTADLGNKTEITAGLADPVPYINTLIPLGWRN